MIQIISTDRTNKASSKDWLEVSKNFIISAYEPRVLVTVVQEQVFTKHEFEQASKKVKGKVKK